jgi:outer membrane beta-barrel protein
MLLLPEVPMPPPFPPTPTRPRRSRAARAAVLVAALIAAAAGAAAAEETAPVYAVQNRAFNMAHELHAELGVLPINAFTKGITLGGGYTYHFTEMWAWEIVSFHYSFGVDTSLKDELLQNFMVQPTQIPSLNYFGNSNLVFTPFYGKLALTNRWLLHLGVYLTAGPAVGIFNNPTVARGGFDAGGGLRFHVNRYFSVRIDLRDYTFFKGGSSTASEMFLGIAADITIPRATR